MRFPLPFFFLVASLYLVNFERYRAQVTAYVVNYFSVELPLFSVHFRTPFFCYLSYFVASRDIVLAAFDLGDKRKIADRVLGEGHSARRCSPEYGTRCS